MLLALKDHFLPLSWRKIEWIDYKWDKTKYMYTSKNSASDPYLEIDTY